MKVRRQLYHLLPGVAEGVSRVGHLVVPVLGGGGQVGHHPLLGLLHRAGRPVHVLPHLQQVTVTTAAKFSQCSEKAGSNTSPNTVKTSAFNFCCCRTHIGAVLLAALLVVVEAALVRPPLGDGLQLSVPNLQQTVC